VHSIAIRRAVFATVLQDELNALSSLSVLSPLSVQGRFSSVVMDRPLAARDFEDAISRRLGRVVTPGKRGPKPKRQGGDRYCDRRKRELRACHRNGVTEGLANVWYLGGIPRLIFRPLGRVGAKAPRHLKLTLICWLRVEMHIPGYRLGGRRSCRITH
jgi:hypothetical protein